MTTMQSFIDVVEKMYPEKAKEMQRQLDKIEPLPIYNEGEGQ